MASVKHAFRLFAKSPGFTATILVTLALGIGANTAVFSVIAGALLRPLPYKDPSGLIDILDTSPREKGLARIFASYADFEEFSKHARTLEHVAAVTWAGRFGAILTGRGPARSYLTIPVTADFFTTLGVVPQLGRTFTSEDLRGGCAVVLSKQVLEGAAGQRSIDCRAKHYARRSALRGARSDAAQVRVLPCGNANLDAAAAR